MTGRGDSASALGAEGFRFENWVAELGSLDLNLEGGPLCFHSRHLMIDVGLGLQFLLPRSEGRLELHLLDAFALATHAGKDNCQLDDFAA